MEDEDLILLVRHGIAQDDHKAGDAARGLTDRGRRKFRKQAKRIAKHLPVTGIVSSPLVRAVQTAELLASACGVDEVEIRDELIPGPSTAEKLLKLIHTLPRGTALVGHNPSLEEVAAALLGQPALAFPFKKGAAIAVRRVGKRGELVAHLAPGKKPDPAKDRPGA